MRKLNTFVPHTLQKTQFEGLDDEAFLTKKRHVFIFTEVGKPVFTRYGDEVAFSSLFASLTTVFTKFLYLNPKRDNELRCIEKENGGCVYIVLKEKLIYICVSRKDKESSFLLKNMLTFLHTQIISLITGQISKILENKINYDPRNLLGGTEKSLLLAIKNALNSPSIFLNSYPTLYLPCLTRARIQGFLNSFIDETMLAAIILTPFSIIAATVTRGYDLQAVDYLLILHLIQSNLSLKNCENWVPICLPGISEGGYVYAYIQFYTSNVGLKTYSGILMLTGESSSDLFYDYSQKSKSLNEVVSL